MFRPNIWIGAGIAAGVLVVSAWTARGGQEGGMQISAEPAAAAKAAGGGEQRAAAATPAEAARPTEPAAMSPSVVKGISWLIAAQHQDGGWGGGSHAAQNVRDPQAVQTDPATTAFTLLSLLRAGQTPIAGEYKSNVRRGLEYLLAVVEKAPQEGAQITDIKGTQPQSKLGQYVDTPLTAQYLSRAIGILAKDDPLYQRADAALDKCLIKLQASQQKDGGWGQGGGWAPVLQSSLSCSALEIAQANGKAIDESKLAAAREYNKGQVAVAQPAAVSGSESGAITGEGASVTARTEASAGVALYSFNGAFRGNAIDAAEALKSVEEAIKAGQLEEGARPTEANLIRAGRGGAQAQRLAKAFVQNDAQIAQLDDEKLLAGFGNNGGEEFLSYLLTSESLVIAGGDKFQQWNDKMHGRLQKIQNSDGSWSGHHCITSPVFCTAAVIQCLTTDRDAEFLIAMAERTKTEMDKVARQDAAPAK